MGCIEFVFKNVHIKCLDVLFNEHFAFDKNNINSSHFYDDKNNIDIEYNNINNFYDYFSKTTTCNLFMNKIDIGISIYNTMIIISNDGEVCDITFNVEMNRFINSLSNELSNDIYVLMKKIMLICQIFDIECVIGYEPAEDEDMKLIKVRCNNIELYNENSFSDLFSNEIFNVAKNFSYKELKLKNQY